MNKFLIIISFLLLTQVNYAQISNLIHFNGWEFTEWKTEKPNIISLLNKMGIKNDSIDSYSKDFTIVKLDFEELETRLYFNNQNQLFEVKQQKEYSVIYIEEAKAFFEKTKNMLIQKYGKPTHEKNDKEKEIITMNWDLEFTHIDLLFDYKYKIIDEFGCCAYKINTEFRPK